MRFSSRLPWYGLLATVVLVPLVVGAAPISGTPLTLNVFVQAKLIVLCLAVAFALGTWGLLRLGDGAVYSGRGLVPLGAFVLVAVVSTVTAIDARLAFFGDWEQGVGTLVFLLCALVCYLTASLVRNETDLTTLTSVVVLTAAAGASIGLIQQLFGFDLTGVVAWGSPTDYVIRRGFGTIGNADTYAAFLVLPVFLAGVRLTQATSRQDRIKWGSCFAVILTSCVAAQTRGPLVGLLAGGVLFAVAGRVAARKAIATKRKPAKKAEGARSLIAIVIAAAGGGFLIAAALANGDIAAAWRDFAIRFGSLKTLMALGGRIPLWSAALQMTATHPILGVGPDSFRLGWYPIRTIAHVATGAGLVITDPHSVPLLLAATMGIAGLLAALYLIAATLLTGYAFSQTGRAARSRASDYDAWLYGVVALSATFLTSMLATVLLFMLFLGLGVLIAPSLRRSESPRWNRLTRSALGVASMLVAGALLAFGLLSAAGHVAAVGAQGTDADTNYARMTHAESLAPWDTRLRRLKYDAMVQAVLEHVFSGKADGAQTVAAAENELEQAARREPAEYLHPYREAVLLVGVGQKLGAAYTARGIEAGLRGLRIYPNSLELRTGVATGYLQLKEPVKAEELLRGLWGADPNYPQAGVTYAQALIEQKRFGEAQTVLSVLRERFPADSSVSDLQKLIPLN